MQKNKTAVIILGGDLIRSDDGTWRTTNYNTRLRVEAGAYIAKDHPDYLIIASGGKGRYKNLTSAVTISSVIKKELLELGIPESQILEESESGTTYQQLRRISDLINEIKNVETIILSNEWHLPRIRALMEHLADLRDLRGKNPELRSAEEAVLEHDRKKWQRLIEAARASEAMGKIVSSEQKGIEQIKKGSYKFR